MRTVRGKTRRVAVFAVVALVGSLLQLSVAAAQAPAREPVVRLGGADRVGTAVAASAAHWPVGAEEVVLATAEQYPDALTGGALARHIGGPVLLTWADRLPDEVAAELDRLGARRVTVVGGTAAVAAAVESALASSGHTVRRLAGADRMATAAAVAAEVGAPDGVVALALGRGRTDADGWADALVTGTLGVPGRRIPTLLTETGALPGATAEALRTLRAREVVVVGGTAVVDGAVVEAVEATGATTRRIAGRDRLATAVEVARTVVAGRTGFSLLFATSADYPDSLVAGGLTARLGAPILLVPADLPAAGPSNPIGGRLRAVAPELADFLVELCPRVDTAHLLGLQGAVSDQVADELRFLLTCGSGGGAGTAEPGAGGTDGPPPATTTTAPAPTTTTTTVPNGTAVVVPDVVGRQQGPAVTELVGATLSLGQVRYVRDDATAGRVLSQDPVGGTSVGAGSPVGLRVSLGPEPLVVPDVVGLDRDDAEDEVEDAGFTVGRVADIRSDEVEVGEVGAQLPLAGQQALPGTPVDLDVAVDATNQPPEITSTPPARHTTGSPYTYRPAADDPDDDDLSWSLQAGPDGASVDPGTGALAWDPERAAAGPTDLVVRVADGRGGIDTQSWTVDVAVPNRAPTAAGDDHVAVIGQTLDVAAAGVLGNDADPDGDDLTARLVDRPQSGTLDLGEDGSFRYTPNTPADDPLLEDVELIGRAGGRATATSEYDSRYPAANVTDGDLSTSWFAARNATLPQTVTITFPGDVIVTDLSLRGNRSAAESGYGVVSGVLRLLGRDGEERFTTGEITLPASPAGDRADRDLDLDVAAAAGGPVAGVRRVQFEIRSVENQGSYPGLAEITVSGDGRPIDLPTTEEWRFLGQGTELTPSVADLDGDGVPEVLFTTMDGRLRVVDGRDGSPAWADAPAATPYSASPVVGDLHPSPGLEVAMSSGNAVTVYTAAGSPIDSVETGQGIGEGNMAVADLDGDGTPELIVPGSGRVSAWGLDGGELVRRWLSPAEGCGNNAYRSNCIPIVADVDLDGEPEIIAGNVIYGSDGAVEASSTAVNDGWNAVGQFDEDAEAEIVLVTGGRIYLLEHDLTVKWGPVAIPQGGGGGAPTVADVDGDGAPEIGVAGASRYAVVDTDGSLLWQAETVDGSSNRTGSTVFDFDNDGATEVVYRDERHLWIFAGPNGAVRAKIPVGSSTTVESPVVADIDADGQAEIVVSSDGSAPLPGGGSRPRGLYVFGGANEDWVRARSIWNQHSYHVTNVGPDGKVPAVEQPSWLTTGLNSYRENAFLFDDPGRADRFTYRAVDEDGEASAPATVVLDVVAPQNDPRITSRPRTTATRGYRYLYAVAAEDPDPGTVLTYELADGPAGMAVDPATGVLSWTPGPSDEDSAPVGVAVRDQTGREVQQRFVVTVREPVVVPDVVGSTLTAATQQIEDAGLRVGRVTTVVTGTRPRGEVDAQDPGPGGVAEVGGRVHLVVSDGPDPAAVDDDGDGFSLRDGDCDDTDDDVVPGAADADGDEVDQDCDGSDGALSADGLLVNPVDPVRRVGGTVQMVASALVDGCTCQYVTQLATWSTSEPGVARVGATGLVTGVAAGTAIVTARFEGHEASRTVRIVAPREPDQTLPTASVTAPAVGARVTQPVDVRGSATDEDLRDWTLVLTRADGVVVAPLGGSSTPVVDGLLATFDPDGLAPGNYSFLLTATDRSGNALAVRHPITVPPPDDPDDPDDPGCEPDCEPGEPALDGILLNPVNPAVVVGDSLALAATAYYDDGSSVPVGTQGTWSTADARVVTVDDRGRVTGVAAGTANVTVAFDGGTASRPVRVVARAAAVADRVAPVARFTTPITAVEVREPLEILGIATDDELLRWELVLTDGAGELVSTIADGSSPVDGGALGTLDPTLLLNGSFTLQLTATDTSGNTSTATVPVAIEGQRKIGTFTLAFTDLVVPVSGIALQVTRSYDTRDDRVGDFGVGWRLGLGRLRLTTSGPAGEGWGVDRGRFSFALRPLRPHTVSLTLPDGTTERFEAAMSPGVSTFVPLVAGRMSFVPTAGTRGRLEALGNREVLVLGAQPGDVELVDDTTLRAYEPERYRYTGADGTRFEVDADGTVRKVTDPNGNTITVSRDGLTHSAGRSVTFERDALDRITAIVDPEGHRQRYAYDADGDLASHTDAEGNTTRYRYTGNHDLLEIIDPLGRVVDRREYDDDGRLIAFTGADGARIELGHDIAGRREVVEDPAGGTTVFTYDEQGNILQVVDAAGGTTTSTYDGAGNQLTTTDPLGRTTTRTYDGRGNALTVRDPAGRVRTTTFDAGDRPLTVTDHQGTTSYTYDARGNLRTTTDPTGAVEERTYDAAGNLVSVEDPTGAITTYEYDAAGRPVRRTGPDGVSETTAYDTTGGILALSDGTGETTTFTVDAEDAPLTVTTPTGLVGSLEYTPAGAITAVEDAAGNRTVQETDAAGRVVRSIDAEGRVTSSTYTATGRLRTRTEPGGRTTTYEHDLLDRVTSATGPDGGTTTTTYDAAGQVRTSTGPDGGVTSFAWDDIGRLVSLTDPTGRTTAFAYDDAAGTVTQTAPGGAVTTTTYDAAGRPVSMRLPDGRTTSTTYDAAGRVTSTTDAAGRTTTFGYDDVGNLVRTTDPLGGRTAATYDESGRLLSVTDAIGQVVRTSYDADGRAVATILPDGSVRRVDHDAAGNVTGTTDGNGDRTSVAHDRLGRPVRVEGPDGTVTTLTYTPAGDLDVVTDERGTTQHSYDAAGRLVGITVPDGASLAYDWDEAGYLAELRARTPDGSTRRTAYGWDLAGRLTSVTDDGGGVTSYEHDAAGRVGLIERPNGTSTELAYDGLGRPTSVTHRRAATVLDAWSYGRDANGDVVRIDDAAGRRSTFAYDELRRLVQESHQLPGGATDDRRYTYDAVGNRLTEVRGAVTTTSTYGPGDRLLSAGPVAATYDADGNQLSRSDAAGTTAYGYDGEGLLDAVVTPDGTATTYDHDHTGARVRAGASNLLVDPLALSGVPEVVATYDAGGAPTAWATHGTEPLSWTAAGTELTILDDATGSARLLTDAVGAIAAERSYSAFGTTLHTDGAAAVPYGFAGQTLDAESGLYHLRARQYDPATGRFTSTDPLAGSVADPISRHPYLYGRDNPLTFHDPTGLLAEGLASQMVVQGVIGGLISGFVAWYSGKTAIEIVGATLFGVVSGVAGVWVGAGAAALAMRTLGSTALKAAMSSGGMRVFIAAAKALGATIQSFVEDLRSAETRAEMSGWGMVKNFFIAFAFELAGGDAKIADAFKDNLAAASKRRFGKASLDEWLDFGLEVGDSDALLKFTRGQLKDKYNSELPDMIWSAAESTVLSFKHPSDFIDAIDGAGGALQEFFKKAVEAFVKEKTK